MTAWYVTKCNSVAVMSVLQVHLRFLRRYQIANRQDAAEKAHNDKVPGNHEISSVINCQHLDPINGFTEEKPKDVSLKQISYH